MRIAQVPPLYESVPPKLYGGTERIVSYLTEELVRQGHELTIFGTADSVTAANLFPVRDEAIRLCKDCKDPLAWHIYQLELVAERAHEFDIVHFHTDYLHYPLSRNNRYAHITTLHGRLDLPDLRPIYQKFTRVPLVSISDSQRQPFPNVNWIKTIYHGLPVDLYEEGPGDGGYLLFLGRISPEKGPEAAIDIAKRVGIKLKIAAKVDRIDTAYFETRIRPLLDHPLIEFVGEVNEEEKKKLLGGAGALLFPIDWPEPFGIVMIEALANGTPVIAFDRGSVAEVIDDGLSGYIVSSVDEAVKAIEKLHLIDRKACRRVFETRFTAGKMASNYIEAYRTVLHRRSNVVLSKAEC